MTLHSTKGLTTPYLCIVSHPQALIQLPLRVPNPWFLATIKEIDELHPSPQLLNITHNGRKNSMHMVHLSS